MWLSYLRVLLPVRGLVDTGTYDYNGWRNAHGLAISRQTGLITGGSRGIVMISSDYVQRRD